MRVFYSLLAITILLSSCSNKFSLQKRKYNKGFYFASVGTKKSQIKTQTTHSEPLVNNHSTIEEKSIDTLKPENILVFDEEKSELTKPQKITFLNKIESPFNKIADVSISKLNFENSFSQNSNNRKHQNKKGLLDILYKAYIGYIAVLVIVALIYLLVIVSTTYSIQQIIVGVAVAIAAILILSLIGSLFTGGF